MARKGKVRLVVPDECGDIEVAIDQHVGAEAAKAALLKDILLVAAALRASFVIVTLDGRCVDGYTQLADHVPRLQVLTWIDPLSGELPPHRR